MVPDHQIFKSMKIAVSGYYGFGNLGDEAILQSLKEGFKGHELLILDRDNRFNRKYIKDADIFISGGGGLLQDKTSTKSFLYYVGLIFYAKLLRKKIYIFAQSIGPITNPFNLMLLKRALSSANLITVRDSASFDFLQSLNLKEKILKTADPTIILKKDDSIKIEKKYPGPMIGICPRQFKDMPKDMEENFAALLDKLFSLNKANIVLIPFQKPNDIEICENIAKKMKRPNRILRNGLPPNKMMGAISQMDLVLGMRLHSLIFAVNTLTPSLGITYDPKVQGFMDDLSQPVIEPKDLKETEILLEVIGHLLETSDGIKHSLEIERRKLYANAELNFELLTMLRSK
ncbi:polysaccharide pyruvyl transferase CsaB [Candidatus Saganbacteria bacterium]|nr:polysaccharide pyruvyl transferase CsaB [Candidatus Saganbacteria bacterium]